MGAHEEVWPVPVLPQSGRGLKFLPSFVVYIPRAALLPHRNKCAALVNIPLLYRLRTVMYHLPQRRKSISLKNALMCLKTIVNSILAYFSPILIF